MTIPGFTALEQYEAYFSVRACIVDRFSLEDSDISCNGYQVLNQTSSFCDVEVVNKWLHNIKTLKIDFQSLSININEFDPSSKFLPPIVVDEKHNFHTLLSNRANQECSLLHGYLSFLDWIYFFSKFGENISGMKVLKYIYSIFPIPFLEHRERVYSFSDMKSTYVIPTQIESCLATSMLELDSVILGEDDKAVFKQFRYYDSKSKLVKDCNEIKSFSFLEMITKYLPWPKEMNSKFRGVLPWCVKYCAFFSKQYRHIFYSDDIFISTADIPRVI